MAEGGQATSAQDDGSPVADAAADRVMPASEVPMVSVVIPCRNGARFLEEAVRSARDQHYEPLEVIVVDDGSTDSSVAVASAVAGVTVLSQAPAGVSAARNRGLEAAAGDLVLFLDADDRLAPDAAATAATCLAEHPTAPMVYGGNRLIDDQGVVTGHNPQDRRSFTAADVALGTVPSPSQSMFRRQAVLDAGGFDPRLSHGEDFDLYLRLTAIAPGWCHGHVVADYRLHPGQATKRPAAALVSMLAIVRARSALLGVAVTRRAERHWRTYFGQFIPSEVVRSLLAGRPGAAVAAGATYVRHLPHTAIGTARYVRDRLRRAREARAAGRSSR